MCVYATVIGLSVMFSKEQKPSYIVIRKRYVKLSLLMVVIKMMGVWRPG